MVYLTTLLHDLKTYVLSGILILHWPCLDEKSPRGILYVSWGLTLQVTYRSDKKNLYCVIATKDKNIVA